MSRLRWAPNPSFQKAPEVLRGSSSLDVPRYHQHLLSAIQVVRSKPDDQSSERLYELDKLPSNTQLLLQSVANHDSRICLNMS